MECSSTAKLQLHTTPEQFRALRQTPLAYRDALNAVSRYACAHGKLSHTVALQDGTYLAMRATFGLPAQLACSVPRQVGARWAPGGRQVGARWAPGGRHLHSPVDEGEDQRRCPRGGPYQEPLARLGPG